MKKLTKKSVEKFSNDDTAVSLVRSSLVMEARAEMMKEVVAGYIDPLFDKFEFTVADDWKSHIVDGKLFGEDVSDGKIHSEKMLYLSDMKSDAYVAYTAACRSAHLANRYAKMVTEHETKHGGDRGWCPALIAESEHREVKLTLARYAEEFFGLPKTNYPHTGKLINLVIGIVLSGPRREEVNLEVLVS